MLVSSIAATTLLQAVNPRDSVDTRAGTRRGGGKRRLFVSDTEAQ